MPEEPKKFKDLLDDADQDRVAFLVYKKAMTLLGYAAAALSLGAAVFVFFGFDKWHDLSASMKRIDDRLGAIEGRASEAQKQLDVAQGLLAHLQSDSQQVENSLARNQSVLNGALVETGKLMRVTTEIDDLKGQLGNQVATNLRTVLSSQAQAKAALERDHDSLATEIRESEKARADHSVKLADFQNKMGEMAKEVDAAADTGVTIFVLQDKHSTGLDADLKVTLGDARKDAVHDVVVNYGTGSANRSFMKENDFIEFTRLHDGKRRTYRFKILNINVLVLRDLVTCELRWEPEEPITQVAVKP